MDPNTNRKCERQHEQLIGAHVSYQLEMKDYDQDSNDNEDRVHDMGPEQGVLEILVGEDFRNVFWLFNSTRMIY